MEVYKKMWEKLFNTIYYKQMKQLLAIKSICYPKNPEKYSLTTLEGLKKNIEKKYLNNLME